MPEKSMIGQFHKSEFFAVLPPGFFAFTVLYSCVAVDFSSDPSLWSVLDALASKLQQSPVLLIFLLVGCYLLGSVFRALPVNWIEKSIPPFRVEFPYPQLLKEMVDILSSHGRVTRHDHSKVPDLSMGLPMDVFNYWKDVLCVNSTEGFEYYQSFETRVRLFAGINWAAWVGVIGSLSIVARSGSISNRVAVSLLFLSLVLLATFASNFRRARRQEARALTLIFIAYLQGASTDVQQHAEGDAPQAARPLA